MRKSRINFDDLTVTDVDTIADITRLLGVAIIDKLTLDQLRFMIEAHRLHKLLLQHAYHSMLTSNISAQGDD